MAEILIEKVRVKERAWIRTHGTDREVFALCSQAIHPDIDGVELSEGAVTCPECISVIKKCKRIPESDLQPEYESELFWRR